MLKLTFEGADGRKCLAVGISRGNVERLTNGQPILFDLADLSGVTVNGRVMIFYEETETQLMQAMSEFIGPDTKVTIDPRLKKKSN